MYTRRPSGRRALMLLGAGGLGGIYLDFWALCYLCMSQPL